MHSTLSFRRLVLASTSRGASWSILNQRSLTKFALAPIASCSIQSSSSQEKKMLPTTSHAVTTRLAKKLLIWFLTVSVNSQTIAQACKVSWSSTLSEVELAADSDV